VQLIDDQSRHLLDIVGRRQACRQLSRDAQLGAQIHDLARAGHLPDTLVRPVTTQRLSTTLALERTR
jgi:hypothetical protein